ncbi:MAG: hypothetical protein PHR00_02235 [Patescibacteria group bacterium]|nr:hypothetical protein [Patescibacteria group bacterium]
MSSEFENLKDIFAKRLSEKKVKPPTYSWQDLSLQIIKDLKIPGFKRSSVFKICKEYPREVVERAVNDTKELCQSGEQWKYFFKVINNLH